MKTKENFWKILLIISVLLLLGFSVIVGMSRSMDVVHAEDYINESYTSSPVITILMHGLGGSPMDWSNDGIFNNETVDNIYYDSSLEYNKLHFIYDKNSIIEKLRNKKENTKVYVVSNHQHKLYLMNLRKKVILQQGIKQLIDVI